MGDGSIAMLVLGLSFVLGYSLDTVDALVCLRGRTTTTSELERRTNQEIATLREELDAAKNDATHWKDTAGKLEGSVTAIRKQAGGQADEYMRLMTENKSL